MEWLQLMLLGTTAIVGGLGTGITIGIWVSKRELRRVFDVVDRMPPVDWFEEVKRKIGAFDPERLRFHFDRGHEHAQQLHSHEFRISKNEHDLEDHEHRLRVVELRMPDGHKE